jgi:uncharacterized protein (UPF0335 family)
LDVSGPGHNSGVAHDKIKSFVERVERLEVEKASLNADIRELYAEAKGNGFDPKILKLVVALRKKDEADRKEQNELLALYAAAVGIDPFG